MMSYHNFYSLPNDVVPQSVIIPTIFEAGPNGIRAFDLYSKLLDERIIMLQGPIETQMASVICGQILYLSAIDKKKDINLYIQSPGGEVTAGLAIYDTMRICGCNVATFALGQVASMGSFLFAAGTKGKRTVLESCRVMIHQVLSGTQGRERDMRIALDETTRLKEFLTHKLADFTGQDYEKVYNDCEYGDKWFAAKDAVDYGLADKIL